MAVRPIDGNKLIEWFRPYLHTGEAIPADVVIEGIRSMPTFTTPSEWVSVEERLPENHAQVLMWSAKWNIAEAGSYYNGRFWVYSEIGDAYIADDITHWMPLPAPPAKGGDR